MTEKFIGEFKFENEKLLLEKSDERIPVKQEWGKHCIWEFNGKRYRPVTQKAVDSLAGIVKTLESSGYKCAVKEAKRKPSSLKYAICTFGVEEFRFVK